MPRYTKSEKTGFNPQDCQQIVQFLQNTRVGKSAEKWICRFNKQIACDGKPGVQHILRFCAPSIRPIPVSYTHLDVYKRQDLGL